MSLLKISNLNYNIKDKEILKKINLESNEGGITCVLGPSGCGKTTLLKLISGLLKIQEGEILLNNKIISSQKIHQQFFEVIGGIVRLRPLLPGGLRRSESALEPCRNPLSTACP